MYHSFLIHSSADGHPGCFHVLAIINSAVMNIGVHMSLSILVSSVCMPSSWIAAFPLMSGRRQGCPLSPLVTSTTGCCFHFVSASSILLELFLHSCLVSYWAPTNLGSSSFSVVSFCLFILFMGFSRQEC